MKKLFTPLFLAITLIAGAQKSDKEFADKYFDKFDYGLALETYYVAHDINPEDPEVTRRIGLCLRKLGSIDESADWFKTTLDMDDSNPMDMLHYAEALKSKEDYSMAVFWYSRYAMANPYDQRTQSHIRDPRYFHDLKADSLKYFLKKLEINTEKPAFGVSAFDGGYLFSTSGIRTYGNTIDDLAYLDIFMCQKDDRDEFVAAVPLEGKINSKYHDGPAFYDPNSQAIYVTRNNIKNGRPVYDANGSVNLKIYKAEEVKGKWNEISELPFNSNEYSTGHPCVSKDGSKMYFVSNMPGGFGGTDIYCAEMGENGWEEPFNCGPTVNTEGNEMFPYLSDEGNLYFSSDGHAGLGGLDIFYCMPDGMEFMPAQNLGFPINSSHDDFGVMYEDNNESGYFSSNRDGKGKDDLFFFTTLDFMKQIFAAKIDSDIPAADLIGEEVTVFVKNTGEYLTTTIDENLEFQVGVDAGDELEFFLGGREYAHGEPFMTHNVSEELEDTYFDAGTLFISKERVSKYAEPTVQEMASTEEKSDSITSESTEDLLKSMLELKEASQQLSAHNPMMDEVSETDVALENSIDALNETLKMEQINNVLFGYDSSALSNIAKAQLNDLIEILKTDRNLIVQISTHTDSRGSREYNEKLSKRRADSVKKYLEANGIDLQQVVLTWHGEEQLANACADGMKCDETLHQSNRRAEFSFILEEVAQALRK